MFFFQHGIMITKEELDARLSEEQEDINQDITVIPNIVLLIWLQLIVHIGRAISTFTYPCSAILTVHS
jgi:hypothetical protein